MRYQKLDQAKSEFMGMTGKKQTKPSIEDLRVTIAGFATDDGSLPPEREMVEELGIPRSRLRRVLASLRDEGLIPPAQIGRRGMREAGPRIESLVRLANPTDVIELRIMIEPQLARLAALKASSLEIARIIRAAKSQPDDDYGTPDLAFHVEIAGATRNTLAREMYRILRKVGADARVRIPARGQMCPNRRKTRDEEHVRIAHAIADRDPDGAEEAMRAHLAAVNSVIADRMKPSDVYEGSASAITGG